MTFWFGINVHLVLHARYRFPNRIRKCFDDAHCIATGGGDYPGLTVVTRAVAKAVAQRGILGGYQGMLEPRRFKETDYKATSGLLMRRGTTLGTANKGKFSAKTGHGGTRGLPKELLAETMRGFDALGLNALVAVGGDGSLSIAQQLFEFGIPLVAIPKAIENDLESTPFTFGFDSAVACATDALDRLHTTAESHSRVMVLEVMGRYAGWIAFFAGIAGGADVILIPEVPFRYESIIEKIRQRESKGKNFTLIVVAEGAREKDGEFVTSAAQESNREARLGGIGAVVAAEVEKQTGKESRVAVLGQLQRGGAPTPFDRVLCSSFGAHAVELLAAKDFGKMVTWQGDRISSVKISDAVGRLKTVRGDGSLMHTARTFGISMGD